MTAPTSTGAPLPRERMGARPISRSQNQLCTSSRSSRRINGSDKETPASPPGTGAQEKPIAPPHLPGTSPKFAPTTRSTQVRGRYLTKAHHGQWHSTPTSKRPSPPSLTIQTDYQFRAFSKPPFIFFKANSPAAHHDHSTPFQKRRPRKIGTLPDPCPKNELQYQIKRVTTWLPPHHMVWLKHQAPPPLFFSASQIVHKDWANSSSLSASTVHPLP